MDDRTSDQTKGKIGPAAKVFLALGVVIFFAEIVFRRWLGPALGVSVQDTGDFTQWPEMLILGVLFPLCMVLAALVMYRVFDRRSLAGFGFSLDRRAGAITLAGLLLMIGGFGILLVLIRQFGIAQWRVSPRIQWRFVVAAAATYIGTGVWEEVYFRGYVFKTLTAYGKVPAYIISIAVFVLIHFAEEAFVLSRILNLVLVSFFLTFVFDKTRSLWPGMILHGCWNLMYFLVIANQCRVSFLIVSGDVLGASRFLSTVLHVVLLFVVWVMYRYCYEPCKKTRVM